MLDRVTDSFAPTNVPATGMFGSWIAEIVTETELILN